VGFRVGTWTGKGESGPIGWSEGGGCLGGRVEKVSEGGGVSGSLKLEEPAMSRLFSM
jgi:hypothetical protein